MPDAHDPRDIDPGQVSVVWGDDDVELVVRYDRPRIACALACPVELRRVGLDDGDFEAR